MTVYDYQMAVAGEQCNAEHLRAEEGAFHRPNVRVPLAEEFAYPPLGDYAYLLDVCNGDRAAVAGLLQIFVRCAREDVAAWEAACGRGSWPLARRLSHKLRSAFHQLGEVAIACRLAQIETHPKAGATSDALASMGRALMPGIRAAISKAEHCARIGRDQ